MIKYPIAILMGVIGIILLVKILQPMVVTGGVVSDAVSAIDDMAANGTALGTAGKGIFTVLGSSTGIVGLLIAIGGFVVILLTVIGLTKAGKLK